MKTKHIRGNFSIRVDRVDLATIVVEDGIDVIVLKNSKTKSTTILLKKKIKGEFVELEDDHPKFKNKYKRHRPKEMSPSVAKKDFYDVNPQDWRPKHVVQYVKNLYEIIYGSIPLELQWEQKGYSKNAHSRSKSWAYAKHMLDKFDKLGVSRKRVKHYLDWCFETKNIPPTMSLLACNNWIDSYNFEFKKKRIRQSKVVEVASHRTEIWNEQTR